VYGGMGAHSPSLGLCQAWFVPTGAAAADRAALDAFFEAETPPYEVRFARPSRTTGRIHRSACSGPCYRSYQPSRRLFRRVLRARLCTSVGNSAYQVLNGSYRLHVHAYLHCKC